MDADVVREIGDHSFANRVFHSFYSGVNGLGSRILLAPVRLAAALSGD